MIKTLPSYKALFVKQTFELGEVFGFETRNKYCICNESKQDIGFVAEQQKGLLGFLLRQFLGHWRTFDLHFFDNNRSEFMIARHPFRWFFQCLDVFEINGRPMGFIERKFSILSKKFEVRNVSGQVILEVSSPIWRIWTFPFMRNGQELARISKKWTGLGYELFTDKDTFLIEYYLPTLSADERALILAAAIYVDLMFFERKGNGGGLNLGSFND